MSKIITIFDGDSLCYRASAILDHRSILAEHLPSGRTKVFKNKTELKEAVIAKGLEFNPLDYLITEQQEPEPLANVCQILKNQINKINSNLFADESIICLSGKKNLRDRLPLPSKYKGQRDSLIRPVHLRESKAYLWKKYHALLANDREADDDLIIKGYEYLAKGYTPILISQDKDAFSASGLTLYDFTEDNPKAELVPDFGSLWDTGKKITGRGFIWLMFQMLSGDTADNWKPSEIAKVKYGEKSAYKLLKDCTNHAEALEKVIQQYKTWYPAVIKYTDWVGKDHVANYKEIFQLYFSCSRMMQHENDKLNAEEFCSNYGVKL